MSSLKRLGISGNLLLTFEAAARHESFAKAAHELNISGAAVSHGIKQLESSLDIRLFRRLHRRIELTPEGQKLFSSVFVGLDRIRGTVVDLQRAARERRVKLAVSIALATFWLLPRLPELRELHPSIDLHLYTDDRELDLVADEIDLAVTAGR